MSKLILLRHGQSEWNLENRFTGWTDVGLSDAGMAEAENAGRILSREGLRPTAAFTSVLRRAVETWNIVSHVSGRMWVPLEKSWRLNERHYGALQGLDKAETVAKHGEEQVRIWRRSYAARPPLLRSDDPRNPRFEEKYAGIDCRALPLGESLQDAVARVLPFWFDRIAPALAGGADAIVSAHGNSLRGLVKFLDGMGDDEIAGFEIPTGVPILYEFDSSLEPAGRGRRASDCGGGAGFRGILLS